jgi:hypothetical protein
VLLALRLQFSEIIQSYLIYQINNLLEKVVQRESEKKGRAGETRRKDRGKWRAFGAG